MTVLLSNGHGAFRPPTKYPVGLGPVSGDIGDLNSDGKPDVVMASLGDAKLTLYANDGDHRVNGDGKPDIVVPGLSSLSVLPGR
jgi:hypothetical protein